MVRCGNCGFDIPEYGNFCPECGALAGEAVPTEDYGDSWEFSDVAGCVREFNLSPAELVPLLFKPKYLEKYFKSPYRVTLYYFILKGILELEIKSNKLALLSVHRVSVKRGPLFSESLSRTFKPYERLILDGFADRNSFKVDTYEKGPLSYPFESETFNTLFVRELVGRGFFEFKKRGVMGWGAKEYVLTDHGSQVREAILNEWGDDLPDRILKYKPPGDDLFILSFFGVDEAVIEEKQSEIGILHRKLAGIEKVYEGGRTGTTI